MECLCFPDSCKEIVSNTTFTIFYWQGIPQRTVSNGPAPPGLGLAGSRHHRPGRRRPDLQLRWMLCGCRPAPLLPPRFFPLDVGRGRHTVPQVRQSLWYVHSSIHAEGGSSSLAYVTLIYSLKLFVIFTSVKTDLSASLSYINNWNIQIFLRMHTIYKPIWKYRSTFVWRILFNLSHGLSS